MQPGIVIKTVLATRLDWIHTTGQLSIFCLCGAASSCISPYCLRCKVTACLAFFRAISRSLVSSALCDLNEQQLLVNEADLIPDCRFHRHGS